ncbi:MAG: flippase-like domain-containing protein [Acidobacteria bacterium]|nr:flippase-like domain-containing protein [Acidobacteriota bacterium]
MVIPAFNEEAAIAAQIQDIHAVLRETGRPYEIIVVDDGSTDRTAACAAGCQVRLIRRDRNYGYGAALKAGIAETAFDWILITDADGTYPAEFIPDLLERLPDADMVVGARTGKDVHVPLARRPAKWFLRLYAGLLAGQSIPDLNSGMRLMRKSAVETFSHLLPSGFSFTSTITLALISNGYRVGYVPIDYRRRVGRSKIRPADFFRFLALVTRLMFLFNPLRLLAPVAMGLLLLGILDFRYGLTPNDAPELGLAGGGILVLALGGMAHYRTRGFRAAAEEKAAKYPWVRVLGSGFLLLAVALLLPKDRLFAALRAIRPGMLALAIPFFLGIHALGAVKWHFLVKRAGAALVFPQSLRFYFLGLFGNLFLPSIIGGDAVMMAAAVSAGLGRGAVVLGSVLNRLLDLASLAMLAFLGAALMNSSLDAQSWRLIHGVAILAVLGAGTFLAFLFLLHPDRLPRKLRDFHRKHRDVLGTLRHPRMYAVPLAISVAAQFALLALTAWVAEWCGVHVSFSIWLLVWPLAKLAAFLPVTLGGIGGREVALVLLLAPFGVPATAAFAVGLAWDGVLIGGNLLAGAISRLLAGTAPAEAD